MPVTWCYDVADESKYCSTGFPIGCHVSEDGQARDACVTSVRFPILCKTNFSLLCVMQGGFGNFPQVKQNKCTSNTLGVWCTLYTGKYT